MQWVEPKPGAALAELEVVIETGREAFIAVCQALGRIRDERLYRESYATFEDYCQGRWGWTRQHVNRQIEAARKVEILEPVGSIPERVLRELPPADDPDELVAAWAESRERNGDRPTSAQVAATVDERRAELVARSARAPAGNDYRPEPDRPEHATPKGSTSAFPTVLAVVVLGPRLRPRILAWQPLSVASDDLSDLDLEHARRHLAQREAELRETAEWNVELCACDRPMPNGEGGCVHCSKGLRS